jgi:hypothetical protein
VRGFSRSALRMRGLRRKREEENIANGFGETANDSAAMSPNRTANLNWSKF